MSIGRRNILRGSHQCIVNFFRIRYLGTDSGQILGVRQCIIGHPYVLSPCWSNWQMQVSVATFRLAQAFY